ncbi:MAG: hypothetical protein KKB13_13280, partial [Chloroflexi bacterium]|nr:hypothetical protein [Chloroflexota bacterium]
MKPRFVIAIASIVLTVLGLGAVAHAHEVRCQRPARPSGAGRCETPQPVVAIYNLASGTSATALVAGPGGAWVQEYAPALTHLAADAAPTGGVAPVQTVTVTLTGITHTLTITGLPFLPVITGTATVTETPVSVVAVSPGITRYTWLSDTLWLSRPVSGALNHQAGLWVQRAGGHLDFLDPATGVITTYQSALFDTPAPAYLGAEPGLV